MTGAPRQVVLCTGRPGVGKSTCVEAIARSLRPDLIDGFVSCEIRQDGKRQGFGIRLLRNDESGLLASPDVESNIRFGSIAADGRGRLGVTHAFLDAVACPRIETSDAPLLVIDEIGPMQAASDRFRQAVETVLSSGRLLLGTLASAEDPWLARVRGHGNVAVIDLTKANRDVVRVALGAYYRSVLGVEVV